MIDPASAAYFFVNPPQVRSLRRHVLPELLERAGADGRRLRVWSIGCGTGEEPYTVAMLLREALHDPASWNITVLGTDASVDAVRLAAGARYGLRSLVMVDPADMHRWFRQEGRLYAVSQEIRSLVQLRHCDLLSEPLPYAGGEVDLALWRRPPVDDPDQVARVVATVAPGGYLLLGPTAQDVRLPDGALVQLGDAYVYRRAAGTASPESGERRHTLPDRRTGNDGAPPLGLGLERRRDPRRTVPAVAVPDARAPAVIDLSDAAMGGAPVAPVRTAELLRDARAALVRGDYDDAAAQAARVCALRPDHAAGWYLRGIALINAHRDADAVVHLREATRCEPDDGFTHFVLAGALVRLGRSSEAGAAYRAAATTLGRPGDELAPELGGHTLSELVRLCTRLADELSARPH